MGAYEKHLKKLYFDIKSPAGFSSISVLHKYALLKYPQIKRKDIKTFLMGLDTYTLNRSKRKRIPRDPIVVAGQNVLWEIDLTFLMQHGKVNKGFKYMLVAVDAFSRFIYAQPMKTKSAESFIAAFKRILTSATSQPISIRADSGGEWVNNKVKAFFKKQNIHFYVSRNETKAAIVERSQRTLKGYLYRYFHRRATYKWIDILQDLVTSYNNRVHRSIGVAPINVTFLNSAQIYKKLYPGHKYNVVSKFRFNIGNFVRISLLKGVFEKGLADNWSTEIYVINDQINAMIPRYKVKSLIKNDILLGTFLALELQQISITKDDVHYLSLIQTDKKGEKFLLMTKGGEQKWFTKNQLS